MESARGPRSIFIEQENEGLEDFSQDHLSPLTRLSTTPSHQLETLLSARTSLWSLTEFTPFSGSHQNCVKNYFQSFGTEISLCNVWSSFGPCLLKCFLGSLVRKWLSLIFMGPYRLSPSSPSHQRGRRSKQSETWWFFGQPGRNKAGNRSPWDHFAGPQTTYQSNNFFKEKREGVGQQETQQTYQPDAMCGSYFDHDDKPTEQRSYFRHLGHFNMK